MVKNQCICQRVLFTKGTINGEIYKTECLHKWVLPFLRQHNQTLLFCPDATISKPFQSGMRLIMWILCQKTWTHQTVLNFFRSGMPFSKITRNPCLELRGNPIQVFICTLNRDSWNTRIGNQKKYYSVIVIFLIKVCVQNHKGLTTMIDFLPPMSFSANGKANVLRVFDNYIMKNCWQPWLHWQLPSHNAQQQRAAAAHSRDEEIPKLRRVRI